MSVIHNRHAEQNPSSQKGDIDSSPTFQSDSAQDVSIASHDATVHTHTEFHHGHFHAEVSHHAGGQHLLQVQNLCVGFTMYEEDKRFSVKQRVSQVIDNLSLSVHTGEILAVVGASGSGKTLLADAILGLYAKCAG